MSTSALCAGIVGSCTLGLGGWSGARGLKGLGGYGCGAVLLVLHLLLNGILAKQTYAWRLEKIRMEFWKL
jgi:hypothetical protein